MDAARARKLYFGTVGALVVLGGGGYGAWLFVANRAESRRLAHRDAVQAIDRTRSLHRSKEHAFHFELSTRFAPPRSPAGPPDRAIAIELTAPSETRFEDNVNVHVNPATSDVEGYRKAAMSELGLQFGGVVKQESMPVVSGRQALLLEVDFPMARPATHALILTVFGVHETLVLQCTASEETFEECRPAFDEAIRTFALD